MLLIMMMISPKSILFTTGQKLREIQCDDLPEEAAGVDLRGNQLAVACHKEKKVRFYTLN